MAARLQQTDEGVAEDGVAHMADVSGLVGIDRSVFDDDPAGAMLRGGRCLEEGGELRGERPSVEKEVDETSARHLRPRDAVDARQFRSQFEGDFAGLASDLPGKVEGERQGHVAEIKLRSGLDQDFSQGHAEGLRHGLPDAVGEVLLESENHGGLLGLEARLLARSEERGY